MGLLKQSFRGWLNGTHVIKPFYDVTMVFALYIILYSKILLILYVFHGCASLVKGLYSMSKLGVLDTENTHKKWFKSNTVTRISHEPQNTNRKSRSLDTHAM